MLLLFLLAILSSGCVLTPLTQKLWEGHRGDASKTTRFRSTVRAVGDSEGTPCIFIDGKRLTASRKKGDGSAGWPLLVPLASRRGNSLPAPLLDHTLFLASHLEVKLETRGRPPLRKRQKIANSLTLTGEWIAGDETLTRALEALETGGEVRSWQEAGKTHLEWKGKVESRVKEVPRSGAPPEDLWSPIDQVLATVHFDDASSATIDSTRRLLLTPVTLAIDALLIYAVILGFFDDIEDSIYIPDPQDPQQE